LPIRIDHSSHATNRGLPRFFNFFKPFFTSVIQKKHQRNSTSVAVWHTTRRHFFSPPPPPPPPPHTAAAAARESDDAVTTLSIRTGTSTIKQKQQGQPPPFERNTARMSEVLSKKVQDAVDRMIRNDPTMKELNLACKL
jgi:hypothetical protein